MKPGLFAILFFFSAIFAGNAQEFETWNMADFDISRKQINRSLDNFDFGFSKSEFNLPSGKFLNQEQKQKGVDMVALIEQSNNYQQRTVDIGSPLPKKEKKDFEITNQHSLYNRPEVENEALNSNPYYRNQRIYQNALHNANRWNMYGRGYYSAPYGRYYY